MKKLKKSQPNCMIKKENFIHIRHIQNALNHGLVLKKVRRPIKFNQKGWLKLSTDMNTELKNNAKNNFKKDLFKLMNNAVF